MAKKYSATVAGLYSTALNTTAALDHVYPLGGGSLTPTGTGTEVRHRVFYSYDGKAKGLRLYFSANTSAVDLTFTVWKNGVATSLSVTLPASSGAVWLEDNVNEVDIVAGDYLQLRMSSASGPSKIFTLNSIGFIYETKEAVTRYTSASNSAPTLNVTAAPTYLVAVTSKASTTTLTDNFKVIVPATGYMRPCIHLTNNTRTQDAELYLNINGTRYTTTFATITAGIAGFYVSDPIPVTQGDQVALEIDLSGGTGSLNYVESGFFYFNDNKTYIAASSGLTILGNSSQRFYHPMGFIGSNSTTTAPRSTKLKGTGIIRNFYHLAYNNNATTNGTIGLNLNGTNTSLSTSVTALTNGVFSDTSNTVSYVDGDAITIRTVRTGSVNSSVGVTSFEIVPDGVGGIPQAAWFM